MTPGTRLGAYEVVAQLGVGGMGEVYRARDLKLGRDVALKVLSASIARTPDRLARFEREARLLAALNHQHVGAIYGIEDTGDTRALVLELVEGDTLEDVLHNRTRSQPLSPRDALVIARQIADALDAAHEKGIIHRDLKPANIKIRPDGVVKVLDFGLGRGIPGSDSEQQDPTITSGGTMPGTVLGTSAYMSPEQARGQTVDKRTDIWAFGCVLYEMLTGVRAFIGDTISDTIVRVLSVEPDWKRLPLETPPAVRRLLQRCLQKDASRRLRDIGDARLDLEEPSEPDADSAGRSPAGRAVDVHFERLTDAVGMAGGPAVSPDGKMVAFVAIADGRRHIWIRLRAGGSPLQITRDKADHDDPRWMPDSSALIYYTPSERSSTGAISQIAALGGPPRRLVHALSGGDVSHDGKRLAYFTTAGDEIALIVSALDGSGAQVVARFPSDCLYHRPRWSPDDQSIACTRTNISFSSTLDVVPVAGGAVRTLAHATWVAGHSWLPDGSGLVYSASTGSTMLYPPSNNLRTIGLDGTGDHQLTFGDASFVDPDMHASGELVASRVRSRSDIWRFPIDGTGADNVRAAERLTRQTGCVQAPSASPDGLEIAYLSDTGGHSNLWLADANGSSARQLTFEHERAVTIGVAQWEPNSERLLYVRSHGGRIDLCLINRDGGGARTLATGAYGASWSPDGAFVYCSTAPGRLDKIEVATGTLYPVRADGVNAPVAADPGIFVARMAESTIAVGGETEICFAATEDGPMSVLAKVRSSRVPMSPRLPLHASRSPDGKWLGAPLLDSTTANVWIIPTDGSPMRAVTDFGDRSVFIARWVSWSPDSRFVYAAVAETDADIVLLNGLF
jgi:Tol biopolymer transport system component